MPGYNKLVRDHIPEMIEREGRIPVIRILDNEEYLSEIDRKLCEECEEYQSDKSLEELADILEVVYAILKAKGWSVEEAEALRLQKSQQNGAFQKRIYLETVMESG